MGRFYQTLKGLHDVVEAKIKRPEVTARRKAPEYPPSNPLALERYEDVKTNLLTRQGNGSVKTILFTGTAHGDGCSTTAINLAAALTRDSQLKVLLLDANLRTPSIRAAFDIHDAVALCDLLIGSDDKIRQIKRVGAGNLYVLPCNGNRSVPLALFESEPFGQLLRNVREQFDYVIMDGPPVLDCVESRVLGAKADGVVLVIASGKTRRQVAARAKKKLEEAGGRILGVVLNRRKFYIPEWVYSRL
jgi:capsular exopolysaccharide synthesis family protein